MGAAAGAVMVGSAIYGAYQDQQAAGQVEAQEARNRAALRELTEIRLKQLESQKKQSIETVGNQAAQIMGQQKAIQAGSGVVVNKGSALDLTRETEKMALEDVETIKNNAALEAWGFKTQERMGAIQSSMNAQAARSRANTSLVSSIGSAAAMYGGKT